jgi:hypothetical protein
MRLLLQTYSIWPKNNSRKTCKIAKTIDWTKPIEFLDKEFLKIAPDANDRGEVIGQEKGEVKGQVNLILLQLDHKFGSIPQESIEQIRALTLKRIKSLSLALLDFGSIEDLKTWLATSKAD